MAPPRLDRGARALSERILRAVRGATSVSEDTGEAIRRGTAELLREIIARNDLVVGDLVSIIFTTTDDLSADFPAAAAREIGLSMVPLLCTREIPVPGALGMCVRVLVHCYVPAERTIRHVYLHGARQLRTDLPE
jgi:chorismate mutase